MPNWKSKLSAYIFHLFHKSSTMLNLFFFFPCILTVSFPRSYLSFPHLLSTRKSFNWWDWLSQFPFFFFLRQAFPTMESLLESNTVTTGTPSPPPPHPWSKKTRYLSGPETALAWESMNLWGKRGNAVDNSRSCTVHKRSTLHHTHWWNLLLVNTHFSKHHFLLEMKEKNHLLLKSALNMIHVEIGIFLLLWARN